MATIQERIAKDGTIRYTVIIRLKGYPTQTETFRRKSDAKRYIQNTEGAIRNNRHFKTTKAKKYTVADMIDRYLSTVKLTKVQDGHIGLHLRRWKEEIGYTVLADIDSDTITKIRDKLLNEDVNGKPRSPTTVIKYMASLSTVFTVAVQDWGWLDDNPMRNIKKPKAARGRVRYLNDDERERLLAACKDSRNKNLYLYVILAISTGMREGELFSLKWQDVYLDGEYLILHETKNDERRRVPVTGHALELLKEYAKERRTDTELLFPSNKDPQKPINVATAWTTARKEANINDFRWHDLRHCTASYLVMDGANLAEIAEILGHKTLQMVKRYAHLSDSHVSNVVSSMNNKIFGNIQ